MLPQDDKTIGLLEKMSALAKSYVPEWNLSVTSPDPGSVVALLYASMLADSLERCDAALHKHKIQYLNLFDRFKEEPIEAAKSFVKFTPVTGVEEPPYIPGATQLLADAEQTDRQVVFETTHGITVSPAELSAVYATDRARGVIVEQFVSKQEDDSQKCAFTAFDMSLTNQEEHMLLLGFDGLLDHLADLRLGLVVEALTEEDLEEAMETLCSGSVRFGIMGPEGLVPFDKMERDGDILWMEKKEYMPAPVPLAGGERYVLAVAAESLCDVQVCGMRLTFSDSDILPDEVTAGGISQNIGHVLPFGAPLEIYAQCGVESKTVFARKGADVAMTFDLSYETLEQLLPEYETDTEYKVIMKRPVNAPKPAIAEVRADYALLEYLSVTGWKRLIKEEHAALMFNGSTQGEVTIRFTMPADMLGALEAGGEPRLRLRLLRADNLYRVPCRQLCPVIDNLRFSYSYGGTPQLPDYACTKNNFETLDVTSGFLKHRNTRLFYTREHEKPTMYMGFDGPFWGTPVSLYFGIENDADYPVDFTAEYLSPGGFVPMKVVDGTGGMLYSGIMLMVIPEDMARQPLFGRDLYWIRIINHNRENLDYNMPRIKGIYRNIAKVENRRTKAEYFYVQDVDRETRIALSERGLISARVYVNERAAVPSDGENWVLWQKAVREEDRSRSYDIDLASGEVVFRKNVFSIFPIREEGPAIRVDFQSYHGSSANVAEGKIRTLSQSVRYISSVSNPMPAFGGYDGYNEETSAAIISNMLRTRSRAVSTQDYFDIVSQVSYGVRRIKCCSGVNLKGEPQADAVTIAVLIDEYEKGGHIFSGAKEEIRQKLLACSGLLPTGKTLILTQPRFVRMSARLWLECPVMENAYDLQKQCGDSIRDFIDPLSGGFEGKGWEIGVLPTAPQLVAYLKLRYPDIMVMRIVITAAFENREFDLDDDIRSHITSPFAIAVNGEHVVYVDLLNTVP